MTGPVPPAALYGARRHGCRAAAYVWALAFGIVLVLHGTSLAAVDPLTGSYTLDQTDLSLQYRSIRLDVTRRFHSGFVGTGIAPTG